MRVPCYRPLARIGDAQLLERVTAEVPVARVFDESLGSLDVLDAPGPEDLAGEPLDLEDGRVREETIRFAGDDRAVQALIVGDDNAELAALLREHCRPEGEGAVARLLRRIQRHPNRARQELQAALQQNQQHHHHPQWQPRYPVVRSEISILSPTVANRVLLQRPDHREVRFYRAPHAVACAPIGVRHGAAIVERLAFVAAITSGAPGEARAFLAFDGARYRLLRAASEIVGPLAEMLEASGSLYARTELDLTPQAHLVARCLLRVGPRSEVEKVRGRLPRRAKALTRPGYLVDSRVPVTLKGREPIVEDPEVVRAVLERTTRGIFLPGEPVGAGLPVHQLAESEQFLILADPGEAA